jgi:WD40 repeat protein/class 3 adenylate cyclase
MSVDLLMASEHRAQVEEFRRKHRTGLLTLVFTDIVESAALKQRLGEREAATLFQDYRALVRSRLKQFPESEEIETAGDSFLLVFATPSQAVEFALLLRTQLESWSKARGIGLRQRVGIHLGEVVIEDHAGPGKAKDLYGGQLDVCARVMSLAGANQILMTRAVFDNARRVLKGEDVAEVGPLKWLNHGPYQFEGLEEPIEVCEVRADIDGPVTPPTSTDKAQRVAAEGELVLGWRPAIGQEVPNTKWVLEEKLGEGGFGEVWKARHEKLAEQRVFKFCFRADRVRSLKREVTLFRLLKERIGEHPNIVRLYDIYFDQPPFYLEEEYVSGKDLKSWCEAQGGLEKVPLEVRLEIVAQAADGLQAAHDSGVIHRDVKPGNILIAERGLRNAESHSSREMSSSSSSSSIISQSEIRNPKLIQAKLTDFGIGQVLSEEYLSGITRAGFTQTMVGPGSSSQTGTQMYMAPELFAGKPASIRSDIYSLGVVLYQLLAGDMTRPLTTDWTEEISDPLLREDLQHCFAGNPQDRFTGAGQMAKNLRALPGRRTTLEQQQAELAARERAAYRRGIIRTASLAAVIVALVTGLAVVALHQSRKAKATALRAENGEVEARRLLYVANMNLAQQAWEQNNIGRLRQLLDETQESPGRGFEWYYWQRKSRLALRTLQGHLAAVTSVAFSPDGQRIVTGSDDHTAKVWEAASGRELLTLKGHSSWIWSVAFSPDGERIVTGSFDHTAKVWEAVSGRELLTLKGHRAGIRSVAFSPDGQRIVTGSEDQTAKVWEAVSGRELLTFKGHRAGIRSVAFSPDGQRIVTGSSDQTATLWEAASGRELLTFKGHSARIGSVAFSPDGQRIVTGSEDQTAKVWEAVSGRELLTFKGHSAVIRSVAFSPDGQRIVTGSDDHTVKVWEAASGRELLTFKGHNAGIRSVAFSRDDQRIVTGSWDQTAKVWEAASGRELLTLRGHRAEIWSVAFSPDGQRIVTGSEDQTAKVWEAVSGRELLTLKGHGAGIWSVAFSPDGQRIITGSWDQTAKVWEAASGRELLTLKGHNAPIGSVTFSRDGQRMVTASDDQTAKVWEAASGRELLTLKGHSARIGSVAFSPDGQRIVTASDDQTAKVWEAVSGRELLTLKGHSAAIWSVAFSPDGLRMVTASDDQTAKVWEAASGRELLTLKGHSAAIWAVAFSPDGQRIITGSFDRTAKLWEVASGRELLTLKGHSAAIWSVAFSPDGQRMVTASLDQTAKVWEAARADQVAAWQEEERVAAEYLGALQRERTTEEERQRIAHARDEGAIKRWLILAPIALATGQSGAEGVDTQQIEGEGQIRPKAGEATVMLSGALKWQEVAQKDYVIDFNVILGHVTTRSMAYAVCYIRSAAEQRGLRLLVGSDDEAKVFLNGKQIYKSAVVRPFVADQDMVQDISLNAGLNVLVFKVVNEFDDWRSSIRFTDTQGGPVKGIKVTLTP